ncbi:uncharacterized protein LOC122308208 [Carya illinoinensis]|uniref:Uncharacterized protein n=2 Tax=Carya illinoinensis TaxID=32201 RepID=A0A8T1QTR9_CARIL|nr:uncharacterized protein LOC122308208 [Carya illinoinensis]KAG6658408.1 hypothetical protein CIPAW_04G159000 [Carya illinoinensis]
MSKPCPSFNVQSKDFESIEKKMARKQDRYLVCICIRTLGYLCCPVFRVSIIFHSLNKFVMNYKPSGSNQMPQGSKARQALQLSLLLGVCYWLLYQIEYSNSKGKDYGGGLQSKLREQNPVLVLGRKGNAAWSSDGVVSNLEDVNLVGEAKMKHDGGGGDDELDGILEEKISQKELEQPKMVSLNYLKNNSDVEGVYSNKGYDDPWGSSEQGREKRLEIGDERDGKDPKTEVKQIGGEDSERQGKESEKVKEIADDSIKQYQDEAAIFNIQDENDKDIIGSKQEISLQPSGLENNETVVSRSEMMLDGVHSFHDENGVPQDGRDLVETTLSDLRDDYENILHQDT